MRKKLVEGTIPSDTIDKLNISWHAVKNGERVEAEDSYDGEAHVYVNIDPKGQISELSDAAKRGAWDDIYNAANRLAYGKMLYSQEASLAADIWRKYGFELADGSKNPDSYIFSIITSAKNLPIKAQLELLNLALGGGNDVKKNVFNSLKPSTLYSMVYKNDFYNQDSSTQRNILEAESLLDPSDEKAMSTIFAPDGTVQELWDAGMKIKDAKTALQRAKAYKEAGDDYKEEDIDPLSNTSNSYISKEDNDEDISLKIASALKKVGYDPTSSKHQSALISAGDLKKTS